MCGRGSGTTTTSASTSCIAGPHDRAPRNMAGVVGLVVALATAAAAGAAWWRLLPNSRARRRGHSVSRTRDCLLLLTVVVVVVVVVVVGGTTPAAVLPWCGATCRFHRFTHTHTVIRTTAITTTALHVGITHAYVCCRDH